MYKKDDPRKIRDTYDKMLKEIKADIEMSDLYGLTKQILDDIDENVEEKEEAKKQKEASRRKQLRIVLTPSRSAILKEMLLINPTPIESLEETHLMIVY